MATDTAYRPRASAVTPPSIRSNIYHQKGIPFGMAPALPSSAVRQGPMSRKISHPCEVTGSGHATRISMDKVSQIVSQPQPTHAAQTAPVASIPQATNDAVVEPMCYNPYNHQFPPIGTPRRSINTPPLSPRSSPQDSPMSPPAYWSTIPARPLEAAGHRGLGLPTPPPSPIVAPEQGLPFLAQPLAPPAIQSAPENTAPPTPAVRSRSQPAVIAHPNAYVQRHVSWDDQQTRTSRINSDPQFQPHILQAPGPIGYNPHPVQGPRVPQIPQQQFYQQFPEHHIPQHRQASYAPPPVSAHSMPQTPVARPIVDMCPYSCYTGFDFRHHQGGLFRDQIQMITQLTDAKQDLANSPILKALAQLTPYDLEAFKYEFQATTRKTLHDFCMSLVGKQKREVKTLVAGLTLGPLEFDMYLLNNTSKKIEEDLIVMFVGRRHEDVIALDALWRSRHDRSLSSAIQTRTTNKNLQHALQICANPSQQDAPDKPHDPALIHRDVNRLEAILKMTFTSTTSGESVSPAVLDMILRRNHKGIQQLALYFETATGKKLDETIRKSYLDDMTKKIAVHAVRTAVDLTYRDVMSLKDVISKAGREEDLAIRVVRAHWYAVHWGQIQAAWMGINEQTFKDKVMKLPKGLFRDLITAMAGPSA